MGGVEEFVARWSGLEGGQERANYALFLSELCDVIEVPRPDPAEASHEFNDYVFERRVERTRADGKKKHGRIDLYKRECFILEAKQSRQTGGKKALPEQGDLFSSEPIDTSDPGPGTLDHLMVNARRQAEQYARALPEDHSYPPFILTCDVGRTIEVFSDFSGYGRHYSPFPDSKRSRINLEDLTNKKVQERLKRIWVDPKSLDPAQQTAKVTREIAGKLAEISKALEARGFDPGLVALFLMRCLFTLFVEDVGLIKKDSFTELLARCTEDPDRFPFEMEDLWRRMDRGEYSPAIGEKLLRFNGKLFKDASALKLAAAEIELLKQAAIADWCDLEPAIFGTLFEQALDPAERKRLGAHYTPRAYVERLVNATIMEPLTDDWTAAQSAAERALRAGSKAAAIREIEDFLKDISKVRVLDPACGTGNFLYVALRQLKQLEGEVLKQLHDLGGASAASRVENISVTPDQFFGLETNPRAVEIAELVLWIGYLQWHLRTREAPPAEPILGDSDHVILKDAVLEWDGFPVPQVVQGKEIYPNARRPDWPEADFIVGNPPFIGKGAAMRSALGDVYTEALWKVHKHINKSADYVMFWWDRAAESLVSSGSRLRRFGFVTTNSITQVFSRRVVERRLRAEQAVSLVLAIPDHPWTKATRDAAAVRIAMTVATAGAGVGTLRQVVSEAALDSDEPAIAFGDLEGTINADLTIGADVTAAIPLAANGRIACNGMMLAGQGFVLNSLEREKLIAGDGVDANNVIRPFLKGGDLLHNTSSGFVIDLHGLGSAEVRRRFPAVYQHALENVKPERDQKRDRAFRDRWWLFGRQRPELRSGLKGLTRYIVTTETSKHRVFQSLHKEIVPDHMIVAIASEDAHHLGVLSSRIHVIWSLRAGGRQGVGNDPRYSKSRCFDPFPFPDATESLKDHIRALAEELDATRKSVLAEHPDLTLTGLYNVLGKLKVGAALSKKEESTKDRGRVLILKDLHEQIDDAVFRAYGWPATLSDDEILERLVALNAARAAEERRGLIKWLRPDYQIEKFGPLAHRADKVQPISVAKRRRKKQPFPKDGKSQGGQVLRLLRESDKPLTVEEIAKSFKEGAHVVEDVSDILQSLNRLGEAQTYDNGRSFIGAA